MDLSATGEPVVVQEDTQIEVGIHLGPGSLTLTQNGENLAAFHALVEFASANAGPWMAEKVKFTTKGPDSETVELAVDLLNEACDGPRAGLPTAIWTVVALAATAA
ncbi:hypothetical protein [Streptomyces xiamenensis]|uniref:hypothetical protein n=1 Tax=Streptomyces xiamenensis TaxID=408015 RepID=UPI0035DD60B6